MAGAALLLCLVIGVADGDTLTARCDAQAGQPAQTLHVRLAEIDAPEKRQPFGGRSHLVQLCHRQAAQILARGLDRYGRTRRV